MTKQVFVLLTLNQRIVLINFESKGYLIRLLLALLRVSLLITLTFLEDMGKG